MKHLEEVIINYDKKLMKANYEIEKLHSTIKEAREYIETNSYFKDNSVKTMIFGDYSKGILEILDKEKE